MSKRYGSYVDLTHGALVDYQYLEEGLRMFLSLTYMEIRAHLPASIAFNFSYADTEKDSLGTLVSKFGKLTYDDDFVQDLRNLVQNRNIIAHRAYLLSPEEQGDSAFLSAQIKALRDTRKELARVIKHIYKAGMEIERILARN